MIYLDYLCVVNQNSKQFLLLSDTYSTDLAENDWNLPIKTHVEDVWLFNFGNVDNFDEVLVILLALYNCYHSPKKDNNFGNDQNLVELCVILHPFCEFHLSSKRNWKWSAVGRSPRYFDYSYILDCLGTCLCGYELLHNHCEHYAIRTRFYEAQDEGFWIS